MRRGNFCLKKHFSCMESGEFRGETRGNSVCLVDSKGYVPLRKQVERALSAGERLEAFRKGFYDSYNPEWEGEPSPLSDPDLIPSVDIPAIARHQEQKIQSVLDSQKSGPTPPAEPDSTVESTPLNDTE